MTNRRLKQLHTATASLARLTGTAALATARATLATARATVRGTARASKRIPWRNLRPHNRRSASVWGVLLLTILWLTSSGDVAAAGETWQRRDVLDAIRWVESSYRENVPDGDGGRAIGPYQIHYVYWLDASSFEPSLGSDYQQCRKRAYAERVIDAYMRRYAANAWANGHGETIAKVHNGGPKGHQNPKTEGYWQRVRKRLPEPSAP